MRSLRLSTTVIAVVLLSLAEPCSAADASSIKTPPGAAVAIVMFMDLQCPACAKAYPIVKQVAESHHVLIISKDFPMPNHEWAADAAVYARFFDETSERMGEDFRGYVYQDQSSINARNLPESAREFAYAKSIPAPLSVDPGGRLRALVQADVELGRHIGIDHVPALFVIGKGGPPTPYVEVVNVDDLARAVEEMRKKISITLRSR